MGWLVVFILLALIATFGFLINANRVAFDSRIAEEERALLAAISDASQPLHAQSLPAPVARYRERAVCDRAPVRILRMRHGGTFCPSRTSKPIPIRGRQLFTADPPGFLWTGRIRMAPGLWIDARDMTVAGKGSMRVLLDDTLTLADTRGEQVDQASAIRLLAEMPWYPTALFDSRYVTWTAVDENHATATLRLDGREVSLLFEFGPDGLPVRATGERSTDSGEMRPWGGVYSDFRTVSGMIVPFKAEVAWQFESGPFTYACWLIEAMDYEDVPMTC
jgi:hypothetical protein